MSGRSPAFQSGAVGSRPALESRATVAPDMNLKDMLAYIKF